METTVLQERCLRFKPFELNLTTHELSRKGQKIRIEGHPLDVLLLLLQQPGAVVTRSAIQDKLWPKNSLVDSEHGLNVTINRLRELLGDRAEAPRFIETLPRLGYRFIALVEYTVGATAARSQTPVESIAVLPLESLSRDPDQEYFADGMTDALISDLGKGVPVRVISRQSIMQYKNSTTPLQQIAQELNADAIVEGTVQKWGDRIRISVQLLHGPTDRHMWAETYEGSFEQAFQIQSEVGKKVAEAIRLKLPTAEKRQLSVPRSINSEAYEDYLRGRFEWYRFSSESLSKAESYFNSALKKEAAYALPYAGLADVWMLRADTGHSPPSEAEPKAKQAALAAVRLDNSIAEPHVSLGNIYAYFERDWVAAEREFLKAIQLNPNSIDAHFMYADFLINLRRNQDWDIEIHKALALDPISPFTRTFYGWHLVYLGRCDEAIEVLKGVKSLQPNSSSIHLGLWGGYFRKQMYTEAMQAATEFFESINDEETSCVLRDGFRRMGYRQTMRDAAAVLASRAKFSYVPCIRIARLYAQGGDIENALQLLTLADQNREPPLGHLAVAWDWDELRDDPRFDEIMRHMGFPD